MGLDLDCAEPRVVRALLVERKLNGVSLAPDTRCQRKLNDTVYPELPSLGYIPPLLELVVLSDPVSLSQQRNGAIHRPGVGATFSPHHVLRGRRAFLPLDELYEYAVCVDGLSGAFCSAA